LLAGPQRQSSLLHDVTLVLRMRVKWWRRVSGEEKLDQSKAPIARLARDPDDCECAQEPELLAFPRTRPRRSHLAHDGEPIQAAACHLPGHSHTLVHSDDLSSQRGLCPELVLAFPELGRGSRPREHDVFVLSVLGEDLSGVEVLDDLAADHRGEHEYANW